ncbi:hypothetical protein VP01_163g2 [Puccinia sorghi]|uniref:Uncharacterized protein n=1 Tax=Puccinia sorghi TaxID=27349 RepID=A0A0L6VGQ6_9BASI|nr:hypothetical protein VP01_163g2 [Puccinia sorghi]
MQDMTYDEFAKPTSIEPLKCLIRKIDPCFLNHSGINSPDKRRVRIVPKCHIECHQFPIVLIQNLTPINHSWLSLTKIILNSHSPKNKLSSVLTSFLNRFLSFFLSFFLLLLFLLPVFTDNLFSCLYLKKSSSPSALPQIIKSPCSLSYILPCFQRVCRNLFLLSLFFLISQSLSDLFSSECPGVVSKGAEAEDNPPVGETPGKSQRGLQDHNTSVISSYQYDSFSEPLHHYSPVFSPSLIFLSPVSLGITELGFDGVLGVVCRVSSKKVGLIVLRAFTTAVGVFENSFCLVGGVPKNINRVACAMVKALTRVIQFFSTTNDWSCVMNGPFFRMPSSRICAENLLTILVARYLMNMSLVFLFLLFKISIYSSLKSSEFIIGPLHSFSVPPLEPHLVRILQAHFPFLSLFLCPNQPQKSQILPRIGDLRSSRVNPERLEQPCDHWHPLDKSTVGSLVRYVLPGPSFLGYRPSLFKWKMILFSTLNIQYHNTTTPHLMYCLLSLRLTLCSRSNITILTGLRSINRKLVKGDKIGAGSVYNTMNKFFILEEGPASTGIFSKHQIGDPDNRGGGNGEGELLTCTSNSPSVIL